MVTQNTYPDINNVANFVYFHIRGKGDGTFCAEPAGEQVPRTTAVTLGVRHLGVWKERNLVYQPKMSARGSGHNDLHFSREIQVSHRKLGCKTVANEYNG